MPRPSASVPPDAIRIEDEVWQEAFSRREPPRSRRLQAIEGGRSTPASTRRAVGASVNSTRPVTTPVHAAVPSPVHAAVPSPVHAPVHAAVPSPVHAAVPSSVHAAVTAPPPAAASLATRSPSDDLLVPRSISAWQEGPSANAVGGVPGRRTVTIRGYGAERNLGWPDGTRRRPQRRAYERADFKPDRVAMWAVLLGVLLVIVAVASAHA